MIVTAPGKIVMWGEYAVLAGAPAAVMSVNRYARVELMPGGNHWLFTSKGFLSPAVYRTRADFCRAPVIALAEAALRYWGYTKYPQHFTLITDSSAFFHHSGAKLGIGSSSAVCAATYLALSGMLQRTPDVAEAMAIHRLFQHGRGSGLDVAASWQGGVIRFENGAGAPWRWPQNLHWRAVWTGTSTATAASIDHFNTWREHGDTMVLQELGHLAESLFRHTDQTTLADYTRQLQALDKAAGLNIFTPEHRHLATLASSHGLVYKPCGAGGGDIGIACGTDPQALNAFAQIAANEQFVPLDLEISPNGVQAR